MSIAPPLPTWRAAALRGLAHVDDHEEALVSLGGEQWLRFALCDAAVEGFRARLGQRVWIDLDAWAVRLDVPDAPDARHA